ncbi:MAG TPA: hypothetical protein VGY58_09805 [Gemmataceae bacterium]|jgi:hypothetical protein|nr:hypothetical protein [Gemmataceae bacterium]
MSDENIDPKLLALESALASLSPAPGRLDRDRLLFRAGQAAAGQRWLWPSATAALAVLSAALGIFVTVRPEPRPAIQIVYVPVKEEGAANSEGAPLANAYSTAAGETVALRPEPPSYFQLEQLVQRWGVEALPDSAQADAGDSAPPVSRTTDLRSNMNLLETQIP